MKITFADLPYAFDALEPAYSERTLRLHYEKHHRGYFDKIVKAIENTEMADMPLEEIIRITESDADKIGLFRNAAQVWNHDMFWLSMRPKGGGKPAGGLAKLIDRDFGSFEKLQLALKDAAVKQFGSGWAWLVYESGKLRVTSTSDAGTPVAQGTDVLLAIDVWEHAYYLDYQNRRPEYIDAFLGQLVNWDFAAKQLEAALQKEVEDEPAKRRAAR